MSEKKKKIIALGKPGGGTGEAVWGSIGGNIGDQTDLQNELAGKADVSDIPSNTSDLTNDSGFKPFIEINDLSQEELVDFYLNYETLMQSNIYTINGHTFTVITLQHPQYGNLLLLESNTRFKDGVSGAAPYTVDVTVDVLYIFADGTKASTTLTYNVPETESLATVATSGSYTDLTNKPDISPSWYGSQAEFDAIPENELDENTDYFISSIDYSEISNTPFIPTRLSQLENDKNFISSPAIDSKIFNAVESIRERDVYLTQDEYDALELADKLDEDKAYHIENEIDTIVMSVTFTDQSTGVYEVYIKPSNGGSN